MDCFNVALEKYPEAKLFSSPALVRRFPTVDWGTVLKNDGSNDNVALLDGYDELVTFVVPSKTDEIVLLHRPSKTLIVADLAFNFSEKQLSQMPLHAKLYNRCTFVRPVCVSSTFRFMFHDADAALAVVEQIVEQDFDCLTVAHGENVLIDARLKLMHGTYQFLVDLAAKRKEKHPIRNGLMVLTFVGGLGFLIWHSRQN